MLPREKDGAWAWVVMVGVLLSQTLLGGMCLSGGTFFVVFQSALNSSTITTSWLCALPITMWFCATPIGSMLTNKFGYRTCSFIGGIIAATGLSSCYFANSMGLLFISFGTLTGLGFGVNYTGCMTAVNVYFDKYKTIATGMVSIGHNLSFVVYPKFIIYLDDMFGWRGSMLIHGAIAFNLCLFASVMSPLDTERKPIAKSHYKVTGNALKNGSMGSLTSKGAAYASNIGRVINGKAGSSTSLTVQRANKSLLSEQTESLTQSQKHVNERTKSVKVGESERKSGDSKLTKLGLFRKSDFCCFCASNILCSISQGIYILHLPPYATQMGFSREDFSLVLTVYGVTNIIGKVIYSFLGQHPKIDVTSLYAFSLAVSGVCICLTPVFLSRTGVLTLAGFVGFFYCVTGALLLAVVFRIVGYEQFANGLGLSLPFKATGNLIGGPLGGTLFALTGDYRTSFYLAGGSMVMAALLMIVPVMKHIRGRRPDPDQIERHRNKYSVCETEIELATEGS